MNEIKKSPINSLGYGFIENRYLPKDKDEYYLRNLQNRSGIPYRGLTAYEIEVLVRNRNTSSNWNDILVSDAFTPELVQNCKFFGLVRIGKLDPFISNSTTCADPSVCITARSSAAILATMYASTIPIISRIMSSATRS